MLNQNENHTTNTVFDTGKMDTQVVIFSNVMLWNVFVLILLPVHCNACPTNCQTCSDNDDGVNSCYSCNDGYWLSAFLCKPCPDNCATCVNGFSCETCKPGFHLPNSICHSPCPTNCLNGICHETTGYCVACPSNRYGYYCDYDCGLCKDKHCGLRKCTDGCKRGYWQYQDGEEFQCRSCTDNCSSCGTWSTCDVCNDGSYLSDYSGQRNYCMLCRSGCETCSSYISCSVCKSGYFGGTCEFSCFETIPDCVLCDWDGGRIITCNQCVNGFTLQDNKCVEATQQCPNNCKSCTEDNLCDICKTGWYGALCDNPCHDIQHCVACQETDGSILCTKCNAGYVVRDGECTIVISTHSTLLPPTFSTSASTLITTKISNSSTNSAVSDCDTSQPSFQTSTFAAGLVTGLGLCICTILVIGLVWFMKRRKQLQKPATSRQNEPFYENSVTANEPNPTPVTSHGTKPENIQEMHVITENVSQSMENNQQASVYEQNEPTSTDIEQHEYTSLNVRQGEHIYKDLTSL